MQKNGKSTNNTETLLPDDTVLAAADAAFQKKYPKQGPETPDAANLGSYEEAVSRAYEGSKEWRASLGKSDLDIEFDRMRDEGLSDAPSDKNQVGAGGAHPLDARKQTDNADGILSSPSQMRSVVDFTSKISQMINQLGKSASGGQGALVIGGKPMCFSYGFRDMSRGYDKDDKGNVMRLYDPLGLGSLSLCVTATAAWHMHVEGLWNLNEPIRNHLPELPECFGDDKHNGVTIRDIFAGRFGAGLQWDAAVLESLGVNPPRQRKMPPWNKFVHPADLASQHDKCFKPLVAALGGSLIGSAQREALVSHLSTKVGASAARAALTSLKRQPLKTAQHSHFAVALAAAALERTMSKHHGKITDFETSVTEGLFKHKNAASMGFGVPTKIRSHTFYEPHGVPSGHFGEKLVFPPGDPRNAAPALFNASLNMFGKSEDVSKILTSSFDAVNEATTGLRFPQEDAAAINFTGSKNQRPEKNVKKDKKKQPSESSEVEERQQERGPNKLPPPPDSESSGFSAERYMELGFTVFKHPQDVNFGLLQSSQNPLQNTLTSSRYFHHPLPSDYSLTTPWTGSAVYIPGLDIGSMCILTCGSWRGRLNSCLTSNMLVKKYYESVFVGEKKVKDQPTEGDTKQMYASMPTSEEDLEFVLQQRMKWKGLDVITAETITEEKTRQQHASDRYAQF